MHAFRTTAVLLFVLAALAASAAIAQGAVAPAAAVRPGSEEPVATGAGGQMAPSVFGNLVVWMDISGADGNIYGREMGVGSAVPITTNQYHQAVPVVFGKRVVWNDDRAGGGGPGQRDIYMQDLAAGGGDTPVVTEPGREGVEDLFTDQLYWTNNDLTNDDIHATDLSDGSVRTIVARPGVQQSAEAHRDVLVWGDVPAMGDSDVYMTDLATGQHTPVSTAAMDQQEPDVYGDVVVWVDWRNDPGTWTNSDIYMHDLSTGQESPVCTAAGNQAQVRIFGDLIVWTDARFGDNDIFMYDLSTGVESPAVAASMDQNSPALYGHLLAWDSWNGADSDIRSVRVDGPPTRFFALEGPTRYETAAKASEHAYRSVVPEDREGRRTVVLATGRNWPDALGASALAGVLDAPVLITQPDYVPQAVLDEIARLDADRVIFAGGEDVVTPAVQTELAAAGIATFERLAGPTRYETADAVAYRTVTLQGGSYDGTAFVATGLDFPDALAAAPIAGAKGWPIFLAGPSGITQNSWAVLQTIGVQKVHILGGEGAVSAAVEQDLVGRLGAANVERHAGPTRYETAVEVADFGIGEVGMQWDELAIATGENFPDALTGGALQARTHSVLLLTRGDTLPAAAGVKLADWRDYIARVSYLGGQDVVAPAVRGEVAQILH
jgi:beta propeller repeat protein